VGKVRWHNNTYARGLKFGMLLQLAIGPMCFLVFNTATSLGLAQALILVGAIALVDAIYISLAYFGIARFLESKRAKLALKLFGGIVLLLFGLNMVLSAVGIGFIPILSIVDGNSQGNLFIKGFLLTASNPLTIVFWSGVLTTQLSEHGIKGRTMLTYSAGLVSSTLLFLVLVALLGLVANQFLSDSIILCLNVIIGAVIMAFGVRILVKKT